MTDTKSPNIQEQLTIHFFRSISNAPWWMRWLWRPAFSHVCVQIRCMIHDLPYNGMASWHDAGEYLADRRPAVSMKIPYQMDPGDIAFFLAYIDDVYYGSRVQRFRCALWYLKLWRRKKPISCATLVSLWIEQFTGYAIDEATPDELLRQIMMICAHQEREYDRQTNPSQ